MKCMGNKVAIGVDDLLVAKNESYQYINLFPTLYFSFKDCKGEKDEIIANIYMEK